ncbi:putative YkwD family protein/spore coat assembly protein SafA [Clostridium algifaecis]|uniref:YkwD family protein/spore coat assembly protein SafA n=1 Tax=Clostridium algifaecis TaxID=1472040 RepID=A0ABS4KPX8_9CLOT|nr:SafA/ExsA family spore coat assembly protein [Clostridium algifaecis]MBP2032102.1 putative YkwD family protein/spore coat assembly protein SafA [Clostridium algifaecis]
MKKRTMILSMFFSIMFCTTVFAQDLIYTVRPGDTLWKIAVANETGVSELIAKNPQLSNPNLIYPGNKINVPNINDIKASETEVVRLVNIQRTSRGLKPLSNNWELERIARYKSQDMANKKYFSHTSPTYGSPFTMMQNFGVKFSAAGENIAMGQKTPAEVVNAWMNSPGHRANILGTSYTQIGVGLAKNNNGVCYWTQMFIRP